MWRVQRTWRSLRMRVRRHSCRGLRLQWKPTRCLRCLRRDLCSRRRMKMASATTWTDCVGAFDECGVCNGPGAVLECGCNIVIPGFCDCDWNQYDALGVCGGTCEQTTMEMASATTSTAALANSTNAASATGLARCTIAGATTFQPEIAIARGTSLTPSACAAVLATRTSDEDGVCDDVDLRWSVRRMWRVQRTWRRSTHAGATDIPFRRLRLRRKPARRPRCVRRDLHSRRG